MESPRVAVIVVAAGSGTRLGMELPKAFVQLAGRSILSRALDSVFGMQDLAQVVVVVPEDRLDESRLLLDDSAGVVADACLVVAGASSRQGSVAAGLAVLVSGIDVVLVHDAARALAPAALFDEVVAEVVSTGRGVIPGLPVSDTIKRVDDSGTILETVDRAALSAVQTPQGFPRRELVAAYEAASEEFTDDAALIAAAGGTVGVLTGHPLAFKITTRWDLRRAEQLIAERRDSAAEGRSGEARTGVGFDVHAYDKDQPLWLAGLYWPLEAGLAGHSDGDAVAHALCDALLSAAGLGDIGSIFGTADPRFDGAHGDVFLTETMRLVREAGFRLGNASVQVIGTRPRFAPRKAEAEQFLSELLDGPVSVSATTTDGLGFTGRGEGLAALANVLLYKLAGALRK